MTKLFAKIENGAVAAYPVDIQRAFPRTSLPKDRAPAGYAIVKRAAPPLGLLQAPVEQTPALIGDEWVQQWTLQEMLPLEGLKAALCAKVDEDAETERLKYITKGAGQSMEYAQVEKDAEAFLALTEPYVPGSLPMLESTVGIDAPTIEGVVDVVMNMRQQWLLVGPAIRALRLGAKKQIEEAETHDAARALYAAIVWPAPPGA